ncbi:class I SAM-dependent RNA methyltransferase [Natronosporangium hydrolyticum]|nr:TRAM domain-containing protein [Natronosporangium hydrolyticum]
MIDPAVGAQPALGDQPVVGERITLSVGAPAHGGHCISRVDGRVIFVRHALPGEQVVAEITEVRRGYLRADAVEVLIGSAERVTPPCPYAHPGGCGGCDLQHASQAAQLDWKAAVVAEQLQRLGGLTESEVAAIGLDIAPLPGGLLGWRTRLRLAVDNDGQAGLMAHRSHEVVPVDRCRISHPHIQLRQLTAQPWPDAGEVAATAGATGEVTVRSISPAGTSLVSGPEQITETAAGRRWELPPEVFWQGHPAAADALVATVQELLAPQPGESGWDLYGGAGLFAAALAESGVAPVTLVESHAAAVAAAGDNLSDLPQVTVRRDRVERALQRRQLPTPVDLVVLDPPRAGAGSAVTKAIMAARPRAVAYVACDPAALARDLRTFREHGWRLASLRGLDCFPMTHHIELVALLLPA